MFDFNTAQKPLGKKMLYILGKKAVLRDGYYLECTVLQSKFSAYDKHSEMERIGLSLQFCHCCNEAHVFEKELMLCCCA